MARRKICKERSKWESRVKHMPDWVKLTALSRAAGFQEHKLAAVKIGAAHLSPAEAKAVIAEIDKLRKAIEFRQLHLFE